ADEGRYEEAIQWFESARNQDPGFDLAEEWFERVVAERDWVLGSDDVFQVAVGVLDPDERFIEVEFMIPDPRTRDAASEAMGVEGMDRRGVLDIIIRGPGGER